MLAPSFDPTCFPGLFFVDDQLVFRDIHPTTKAITFKWIAPAQVRHAFHTHTLDSGPLPAHTIRYGWAKHHPWFLMDFPAKPRMLHFDSVPKPLIAALPRLLFFGWKTDYHIWAALSTDPNPALYTAPLPNTDNQGSICFGSNTPPLAAHDTMTKAWNLLWSTPFTQDHCEEKCRCHPHDVRTHFSQPKNPEHTIVKFGKKHLFSREDTLEEQLQDLIGK